MSTDFETFLAQAGVNGGGGGGQGFSGSGPSTQGGDSIYWTTAGPGDVLQKHKGDPESRGGAHSPGTGETYRNTNEAMGWLFNQSTSYRNKIIRDLQRAGFVAKGAAGTKAYAAGWSKFLGYALQSQLAQKRDGQPILTALQLLAKWQKDPLHSPYGADNFGNPVAGTVLNTQSSSHSSSDKQYDITKPLAAKNLINSATAQELGQTATAGQVKQFTGQLNRSEQKNPGHSSSSGGGTSVTTAVGDGTTHTTATDSSSGSSHTGYSGQDRAQQAIDFARAQPEWASYQGATTFMDAFVNSIAAPVSVR